MAVQRHDALMDEEYVQALAVQRHAGLRYQIRRAGADQARKGLLEEQHRRAHEADAGQTLAALPATFETMARHQDRTVRQAGNLYKADAIKYGPLTLRSDSKERAGPSRGLFFTGDRQTNEHDMPLKVAGVARNGKVYLRNLSQKKLIDAAVHEASHIQFEAYVRTPLQPGGAGYAPLGIYHKFADEFRAYWSQPYKWTRLGRPLPPAEKARQIQLKIVGTGRNDPDAYDYARDAYYGKDAVNQNPEQPRDEAFKAFVDGYETPEDLPTQESAKAFQFAEWLAKRGAAAPASVALSDVRKELEKNKAWSVVKSSVMSEATYRQRLRQLIAYSVRPADRGRVTEAVLDFFIIWSD